MLWTYSKAILEHFLNFRCSLNCNTCFMWHLFHVAFNNHSGWKLLKACTDVEDVFLQSICTYYMYVSICFEFDKKKLSLTSFAYVKKKKKKGKKVISSTSNIYMNWLKLNMKIESIMFSCKAMTTSGSFYFVKKQTNKNSCIPHQSVVGQLSFVSWSAGTQGMSSVAGNEKLHWFSRRNFICTFLDEAL